MPLPIQQLKGNLKLGVVTADIDVSASVTSMTIKKSRESITVPATLATGKATQVAGAGSETLDIVFHSSMAAASLWAMLYDAMDTDTAELKFEGTLDEGLVGADNPKFSGTIVILGVDTGGAVGALRQQTQSYPITAAGITKAII